MIMKILVFSDSHSSLYFMRMCIEQIKPDTVIHLGDHYDDGTAIAEENPNVRFFQVPGNCDGFRMLSWQPEVISCSVYGVRMFMTHGHKQSVKSGTHRLLLDARKSKAEIVLYGHTHAAECRMEEDGLWVMNPGSCRGSGGSVGLIEIENEKISSCRILRQEDVDGLNQEPK